MSFLYQITSDDIICRKIHRIFSSTPYGRKLKNEIRFAPYKPSSLSNKEWEKMLGRDVNNLHHMPFTAALTRRFVNRCRLNQFPSKKSLKYSRFYSQEEKSLILVAQIHDWAEAIIGDIPKPLKTEKQEEEEIKILKEMVKELLSREHQNLIPFLINSIYEVMENKDGKLAKAFDAIERMGYQKVSLRAWALRNKFSGETKEKLTQLAAGPTCPIRMDRIRLLEYQKIYPPVYEFLSHPFVKRSIDQILYS